MSMPVQSGEVAYEPSSQQQPKQQHSEGRINEACGAKDTSIDGGGLRSPLEDADIFNTLFNKWGSDEATEVREGTLYRQGGSSGIQASRLSCAGSKLLLRFGVSGAVLGAVGIL
jgi:hypothetical protein